MSEWTLWSPDGVRLAFDHGDLSADIYTMPADGSSPPEPVGPDVKGQPSSWSRDNVLAFLHAAAARYAVYVRPFPQCEPRQRISTAGGIAPERRVEALLPHSGRGDAENDRHDGSRRHDRAPKFTHTRPRELFRDEFGGSTPIRSYDIGPDGKRFVMLLCSAIIRDRRDR